MKKKRKYSVFFLSLAGLLSILYFMGLIIYCGLHSEFFFFWLFAGVGCFLLAAMIRKDWIRKKCPVWLRRVTGAVFCVGLILFLAVEAFIFSGFTDEKGKQADYVVVLGAYVRPDGPSKTLKLRLDRAVEYANQNPETTLVVSGGKGGNEVCSEAEGMYEYLVKQGVASDRILQEDKSTSTSENLMFTKELLIKEGADPKEVRIGIISNDFHIYRAVQIARKAGYENCQGIGADSDWFTQPTNLVREFFGVGKDVVAGNMDLW